MIEWHGLSKDFTRGVVAVGLIGLTLLLFWRMLLAHSELLALNLLKFLVIIIVNRELRVTFLIEFETNWHGTSSYLMLLILLTIELLIKILILFKVIIPATIKWVTVFSFNIMMRQTSFIILSEDWCFFLSTAVERLAQRVLRFL